jgi:hypothetical protein
MDIQFLVKMDESIDQRIDKLRTNLAYTPPEMWNERFEETKLQLKTHLRHHLSEETEK